MIRILATIFAGLLGLAFGSFLNVCLSRWPTGESIVSPRSHCRNCDHTLAWWENIPLLSWLILRGRCRSCKTAISWRYPSGELTVGALWSIAALMSCDAFFPLEFALGPMCLLWLLVCLALLDAEHFWLPNFITLPGIGLGFIWWFLQGEQVGWAIHDHNTLWEDTREVGMRLLGVILAALLILLIRWLYKLIRHQEGIGLGDAKLMAMLAAWLGLPGALLAFGLGTILAALAGIVLLAVPAARTNPQSWATSKLPLGTFLCIGGVVSSLWGQPLIAAYLRWASF